MSSYVLETYETKCTKETQAELVSLMLVVVVDVIICWMVYLLLLSSWDCATINIFLTIFFLRLFNN